MKHGECKENYVESVKQISSTATSHGRPGEMLYSPISAFYGVYPAI